MAYWMPVSPSPNPFSPSLVEIISEIIRKIMKKILLPELKFEKLKSKIPVIISHENGPVLFFDFLNNLF